MFPEQGKHSSLFFLKGRLSEGNKAGLTNGSGAASAGAGSSGQSGLDYLSQRGQIIVAQPSVKGKMRFPKMTLLCTYLNNVTDGDVHTRRQLLSDPEYVSCKPPPAEGHLHLPPHCYLLPQS